MGRLIIDGNSFFEIDEECLKTKRISQRCGLDQYLKDERTRYKSNSKMSSNTNQEYNMKRK